MESKLRCKPYSALSGLNTHPFLGFNLYKAAPSLHLSAALRALTQVTPNPSFNHRTRYGGLSWPGLGYTVHSPSPGQAIPPHRAG
jgi:hypothetical protein